MSVISLRSRSKADSEVSHCFDPHTHAVSRQVCDGHLIHLDNFDAGSVSPSGHHGNPGFLDYSSQLSAAVLALELQYFVYLRADLGDGRAHGVGTIRVRWPYDGTHARQISVDQ